MACTFRKNVYFWSTILLETNNYQGRPFPPHAHLPIDHSHFKRWLELFGQTVDELFEGLKATEAKWRAGKMGELFEIKIKHFREQGFKDLL